MEADRGSRPDLIICDRPSSLSNKDLVKSIVDKMNAAIRPSGWPLEMKDEYYNMAEVIEQAFGLLSWLSLCGIKPGPMDRSWAYQHLIFCREAGACTDAMNLSQ